MFKRIVLPYLSGLALFVALAVVYMAGVAVWNSTINVKNRTWHFTGKEYDTALMVEISKKLQAARKDTFLTHLCANPKEHQKGYSGILHDQGLGESAYYQQFENITVSGPTRWSDRLACHYVMPPESDSPMIDFINITIFSPLVSWFGLAPWGGI